MQYILTVEELKALNDKIDSFKGMPSRDELQKICTKIADEFPIKPSWMKDRDPAPWQCIRTVKYEWYCDECPVKTICPYPHKHHSK